MRSLPNNLLETEVELNRQLALSELKDLERIFKKKITIDDLHYAHDTLEDLLETAQRLAELEMTDNSIEV